MQNLPAGKRNHCGKCSSDISAVISLYQQQNKTLLRTKYKINLEQREEADIAQDLRSCQTQVKTRQEVDPTLHQGLRNQGLPFRFLGLSFTLFSALAVWVGSEATRFLILFSLILLPPSDSLLKRLDLETEDFKSEEARFLLLLPIDTSKGQRNAAGRP